MVDAGDPEATAGKLQGVAARSAAQIEHGGPLWGMDEAKNLLGFAHGSLARAKLREEKALQPLPEYVIFKPGPHVHNIRRSEVRRDQLICPVCKSARLIIWTTLGPK